MRLDVVARALSLAVLVASTGSAQTDERPLRGVTEVMTLVKLEFNEADDLPRGLTEARLRTLLDLRLRSAGILVTTDEENSKGPDVNPYALLRVCALRGGRRGEPPLSYVFIADAAVLVISQVPLNGAFAPQELWSKDCLFISDASDAVESVERTVGILLDDLVNEWLAANPRRW